MSQRSSLARRQECEGTNEEKAAESTAGSCHSGRPSPGSFSFGTVVKTVLSTHIAKRETTTATDTICYYAGTNTGFKTNGDDNDLSSE
jgi:hypothetical protein